MPPVCSYPSWIWTVSRWACDGGLRGWTPCPEWFKSLLPLSPSTVVPHPHDHAAPFATRLDARVRLPHLLPLVDAVDDGSEHARLRELGEMPQILGPLGRDPRDHLAARQGCPDWSQHVREPSGDGEE